MGRRNSPRKKGLEIRDVMGAPGVSIESLRPASNEEVYLFLELAIGRADETGEEKFTLTIATPEALVARANDGACILADRAILIVREFNWRAIRSHIEEILKKCEAPTLHDAIPLLQRYFRWEYEDYKV
jgi:hypothetical protein